MLFFDLETTNHSFGSALDERNRVLMVSWCIDDGPIKTFRGDIRRALNFWADVEHSRTLCAFHGKFEMHWLKRHGFDIDTKGWHDPMLAEKVLLGNQQLPMNLGDVSERYGYDAKDPMIDSMMKEGVCPSDMPQNRLAARCVRDVRTMRSLMRRMLGDLKSRGMLHLYRCRCDFLLVLCHMEANGMHLDRARVYKAFTRYKILAGGMSSQLTKLTGGINMNSPKQKAAFLYDKLKFPERKNLRGKPLRTAAGGRKTDKATMMWLQGQAKTKDQKSFISLSTDYSKASAALSKNLEFFKGVCDERDGHFYMQFNQVVAATHRLTGSGIPILFDQFDKPKSVQPQNSPREFKGVYKAPEGYVIAEVDAMQLEFRVAAFLGRDKQAMADIADPDFDAHCRTASVMQGIDYMVFLEAYRAGSKKHKKWRQDGKPDTFKPLYGGTRGTPEQEKYYKAFSARYAGITAEQENWLAEVMSTGTLKTGWGMEFSWDVYTNARGVAMNKKTHKPVGPQVFNYPVQNLATAEIVPIAIIALYRRCKEIGLDVLFVNTVHDSVIVHIRDDPETIRQFWKAAAWAFTSAVYEHLEVFYGLEFDVPLGAEMVVGSHWGDGEEFIYDDVIERKSA